jgi:hypothetical protein
MELGTLAGPILFDEPDESRGGRGLAQADRRAKAGPRTRFEAPALILYPDSWHGSRFQFSEEFAEEAARFFQRRLRPGPDQVFCRAGRIETV